MQQVELPSKQKKGIVGSKIRKVGSIKYNKVNCKS